MLWYQTLGIALGIVLNLVSLGIHLKNWTNFVSKNDIEHLKALRESGSIYERVSANWSSTLLDRIAYAQKTVTHTALQKLTIVAGNLIFTFAVVASPFIYNRDSDSFFRVVPWWMYIGYVASVLMVFQQAKDTMWRHYNRMYLIYMGPTTDFKPIGENILATLGARAHPDLLYRYAYRDTLESAGTMLANIRDRNFDLRFRVEYAFRVDELRQIYATMSLWRRVVGLQAFIPLRFKVGFSGKSRFGRIMNRLTHRLDSDKIPYLRKRMPRETRLEAIARLNRFGSPEDKPE
ncbi:hypothetical protein [Nocardia arthritidis]|uniref:hypothetical protein n=1 Tax=Nocardia arthritidis TaxID=228602 RepID=UPI000A9E55B9|nr:hypothetical protein [Nocardia arthritidis]